MESIGSNDMLLQELSNPQQSYVQPTPPLPREKNKRPQLSCNPCRARKVKCDRIQPCSACSLHQIAEICQYDLSEAERQPILQAEALKEKDKTIGALREEINALRGDGVKSEFDERTGTAQKLRLPPRSDKKSRREGHPIQVPAQEHEHFLFAESGVMHMADDFNQLSFERGSVSSGRQRNHEAEIFAFPTANSYPFPTLWAAQDDTSSLTRLLPPEHDLFFYLESFQRRSLLVSFPLVPEEVTEGEVRKFLQNLDHNASLYPDYLALLFATLALGLHDGVFDKLGDKWAPGSMESESKKADVYAAASMQCLRLAAFMNRPTLLVIKTLIMMAPCLTNSGKFLDASALFALTVRLAQAIGLHRDPSQLAAPVSPKESSARRTLWWWMIYMDQQYSITLGRPSAISVVGDCPSPESLLQDPIWQSISDHIGQFTMMARQILSKPHMPNDNIDQATDDLLLLQKSLPQVLQFNRSWLDPGRPHLGWPLDVQAAILHAKSHNIIICLNRRRAENPIDQLRTPGMTSQMRSNTDIDGVVHGRPRVLDSCRALLHAFEFFHTRLRAGMVSWTMGQMAFNASMLLTLSMLETGETQDLLPVQHAYSTFLEMNKLGIHKLAGAAVERLGRLMKDFPTDDSAKERVMGDGGMMLLEDPGSHKLVPESPGCGPSTNVDPDMAKTDSTPPQRTKLSQQRRRQAKRATATRDAGISKSRRSSFSKSQRPLLDRRFSDSVAPQPLRRRRPNRSTPNLSLLTTLSDQDIFSVNSTAGAKSETLFTPFATTFDGLQHTAFPSPAHHLQPDVQQVLDDISDPQGQAFQMPSQQQAQSHEHYPHTQSQAQQKQQPPQQGTHPNVMTDQTMQASLHSANPEQQNFDFSSTSTPYTSDFSDATLSAVVGNHRYDEDSLHFDHEPFPSASPFSMAGEQPPFVAGPF